MLQGEQPQAASAVVGTAEVAKKAEAVAGIMQA